MSRHGYVDDIDDYLAFGRYRGQVMSAIRGKRGQAFLRELADVLDAMEVKELIEKELVTPDGQVCAIGAVARARGVDVSKVDPEDYYKIAKVMGIARALAREIMYENDYEWGHTPAARWRIVRRWVDEHLRKGA